MRTLAAAAALTLVACAQQVPPPEVTAPSHRPPRDHDLGTTTTTARTSTTRAARSGGSRTALRGYERSAPSVAPVSRSAPTSLNWAALRRCESGDRNLNTGNGYYGYHQFNDRTWRSVTGRRDHASDASFAEQQAAAEKLYSQRGGAPWPYCRRFL